MEKKYKFIKHTSDVGIEVRGKDLKDLINNLLSGFFEIYYGSEPGGKEERDLIEFEFESYPDFFVDFINELVFRIETGAYIPVEILDVKSENNKISVKVKCIDSNITKISGLPIKAATYHQLKFTDSPEFFLRIIFDV